MSFLSNLPSYNRSNFSDVTAKNQPPKQLHSETLTPTYNTCPPPEHVIGCDQQHLLLKCYNDNHPQHAKSLLQQPQTTKRKREEGQPPSPAPPPKTPKLS
mmetsp:Transcript_18060/g.28269  ORF Transcript_18060/g.28269 Transcript_18060/m.28269 type:complete len:100 (-) Transcript_18060:245-544(-)